MISAALALRDNINAGQPYKQTDDPFASSISNPIQSPKPCAHIPARSTHWQYHAGSQSTNAGHDKPVQYQAAAAYKPASVSSSGSEPTMTPVSSIDLEKVSMTKEREQLRSAKQHDPEKAMDRARTNANRPVLPTDSASLAFSEEDDTDDARRLQEKKALNILLYLSGPCVFLSSLNTAWACIALVITMLTQPIRLCARRPSFGQQLAGLLGPTLNLQLRCIYTPLSPHANEDGSYHPAMLFVVHILSPFLSLGMMLVTWVVAVFWVSSMMVGDPVGTDKRDDGRETVLALRRWWECWLTKGVKEM